MEFQDRILRCVDCATEFVWTAGEQQFFADKNFKNEPKRCKACKSKRAARPAVAGVAYIDSAGLGEVVRTYTTVSRQGGSLKLLNLTKRITDLLSITKLLTVFETYDSEADAVRSFSSSARV